MAKDLTIEVPHGYCHCGCGEKTPLAPQSNTRRGWVRGEPIRFVQGHHFGKSQTRYVVNPESGCWVWQRSKDQNGYGKCWDPKKQRAVRTHVFYYEQQFGEVPEGLELDHLCRNRSCCNPAHLEPVTRAANTRRGRSTKLTVERATEIRHRLVDESPSALAREYGIGYSTVRAIRDEITWRPHTLQEV